MSDGYISVRNWRKFQHYDPEKRTPPWIKNQTELMAKDEYLELSEHRALMLHRLWLEYASSHCRLSADTAGLSRRLFLRATMSDLEALKAAGFIDIVASAELAEGYHAASASRARVEVEVERDRPKAVDKGPNERPDFNIEEHLNLDAILRRVP